VGNDQLVSAHIRNLRHPVEVEIDGRRYSLVTTGYLAAAIGRTPRTVRLWQEQSLLPRAPFVLHFKSPYARRWLYPAEFVDAVADIAAVCETGKRMDKSKWDSWEKMIDDAEEEFISPLLGLGVTQPIRLEPVKKGSGALPKHSNV